MYLRRTLENYLSHLSATFPVVLVTGPRQIGKTTLVKHLGEAENPPRQYVSLDEYGPRSLAVDDPDLFLQRYPAPLTIDEIQHAPALLDRLKLQVDRSGRMGDYWLTGSQHFPLMRAVSESLAGRIAVVALLGFSQAEEHELAFRELPFRPDRPVESSDVVEFDLLSVFERIVRGGFPRLVHSNAPPLQPYHGSYVQTYIERDVRSILNIADLAAFRRFLRVAAARTGQMINYSDMARDAGVAVSTAREWLHLLEATFQVHLLRPYYENITKRQIKTPKLYFTDTGLVCYLTGWRTAETAASGAMAGALFETYIVSELLKSWWHRGLEAPLWYYRTKDRAEVDVLVAEDGLLFPLEIKLTARPSRKDLSGILALERAGGSVGEGAVICLTRERFPLRETVDAVPVGSVG